DADGHIVWLKVFNRDKKKSQIPTNIDTGGLSVFNNILEHETIDGSMSGILVTGKGLMIAASRPIVTSEEEGPIRGTVVMARYLDNRVVNTLATQTRVQFKVIPFKNIVPAQYLDIFAQMTKESPYVIKKGPGKHLRIYSTAVDIMGNTAFLAEATIPLRISSEGASAIGYATFSTITAVFLIMGVMLYLIQKAVVNPITHLKKHAVSIGTSGNLSTKINLERSDEIGKLADEFNRMMGHLDKQNTDLEMLGVELTDDIIHRREAEEKLKLEIEKREKLAKQREELLEELNSKNKVLENMAITDSLTNFYNHKYIIERLGKEILKCQRYKTQVSIILLDIDFFKIVNDTYGHQVGDDVLVGVSDGIRHSMREVDIAGRYGGEEFLLILPNTNLEGALISAERVRVNIQNLKWDIKDLTVTISSGVATQVDENASLLIEKSDKLLYLAKDNGRNRVEC
ncbi:MAG: diguanylate cyclase, partial [bacterium]|nr:diguanylate cyclase [bacterium]